MQSDKVRDELELRQVGLEHLEQFDELLRYVFQVTPADLQESGYEEGELQKAKRPILKRSEVLGWFKDERLVSSLSIYPCSVNIFGTIFKMAGLTGVGTYPEYANLGLMNELINEALRRMRHNEQWISYLYPFSIPFYRHKGWEIISDHLTFTIKDSQLPKSILVPGLVEREDIDHPDVLETYNRFARLNHGAMIRNEWDWEEYWRWENEEERVAAIYYDEHNVPMGYVLYWISEDIFNIKEIIYLSQEARAGLWNFISAHFSMIDEVKGNIYKNEPIAFLLEDSKIQETIEPYYMARIVDVEQFLKRYPFAKKCPDFHFNVTDKNAPWNNDVFGIHWDELGEVQIIKEPIGAEINIDIQTLTTLLMNYRRPTYFYTVERLQTSIENVQMLEEIIPKQQPYFSDYF